MKVILAGYNVDSHVIDEAQKKGISRDSLTPEVLSAAYARISRNPAPVNVLRRMALEEVESARRSNQKIIFGMGHHSVAEHAVFNFDILGVSRLAIEALEHFRLCSYTEKSQRYITLDNDVVIPEELIGTPFERSLKSLIVDQGTLYDRLHKKLLTIVTQQHPEFVTKKSGRTLLDGWAKEDARYVTLLCTSGQLGFTANARNLELIIKRLNASPLAELRDLSKHFYQSAHAVAPSILLFTAPTPFESDTKSDLSTLAASLLRDSSCSSGDTVTLVSHDPDADTTVAAALLSAHSEHSYEYCRHAARRLSADQRISIFKTAMEKMAFFDTPPRELEHVHLSFEITLSAAAYGQLKRHRIMSQSAKPYNPALGVTVPPSVIAAGEEDAFRSHATNAETLYWDINAAHPEIAPYSLTNAHRRTVLLTTNLRDLYHFCRLREDAHAQWDIRNIATKMRCCAETVMPLGSLLLCGKDRFEERYAEVFGGTTPALSPSLSGV